MTPEFWKGRRVFLTGHTGFKGAWLAMLLKRLGAEVFGFALSPPTSPSLYEVASVERDVQHSTIGDIRDLVLLSKAVRKAQPDIILHLAAQAIVRESYQKPVETYSTNVMGTVHVLEAAREVASLKAIVVVTTDKVYRNEEWSWGYREIDALGGHDPYSNSKSCAELATAAYRSSFFSGEACPRVATARAGNVIGGGDWAKDRLVHDVIASFVADRPVSIRNPNARRPWQHVLDPLSGYLSLAEHLAGGRPGFADAWNFGPDERSAQTVAWIVERLAERWQGGRWERSQELAPHEAQQLKLDISKAADALSWRPKLSLELSLDWTLDWHRAFIDMPSIARTATHQQIETYLTL